jgi:hypothetical protein
LVDFFSQCAENPSHQDLAVVFNQSFNIGFSDPGMSAKIFDNLARFLNVMFFNQLVDLAPKVNLIWVLASFDRKEQG